MNSKFIEGNVFEGMDFSENGLERGEYENCNFVSCNFSNTDLSGTIFIACNFQDCNISLAKISHTAFREVKFLSCKLLGLHFEDCNGFLLSMGFDGCQLNLSSFYKLGLRKSRINNCSLKEVDFTESDLSHAIISNCDLDGAIFKNTNLEKVDFRTSYNYSIDPETNRIKKARFSMDSVLGLLVKYNIIVE